MLVILLLPEALDRWTVVSARGSVVEGMAKRAIRAVSRSCCGDEGMRGGELKWLNYFQTLAQPYKFKIPFHMYFEFNKIKRSKRIVFYCEQSELLIHPASASEHRPRRSGVGVACSSFWRALASTVHATMGSK